MTLKKWVKARLGLTPPTEPGVIPEHPLRDDLYIVTFPKSGTTWLTYLIANVLVLKNNDPCHVRISNIDGLIPPAPHLSAFQQRCVSGFPGRRIFKTHSAFDPRIFNLVHVVRDPRDVIVSYFKMQVSLGRYQGPLSDFVRNPDYGIEAWVKHTAGWVEQTAPDINYTCIRYEDLLQNAPATVRRIFSFFGHEVDEATITTACERCTFERMKADETAVNYGGRKRYADFAFFREGRSGDARRHLSADDLAYIESHSGRWIETFGYRDDHAAIVAAPLGKMYR